MKSPAAPRSKPPTLPSAGSSFSMRRANPSSRETRSRTVFAYSTRFIRRSGTRPPAPWAVFVVSSSFLATHEATAKASFASGRGFFFGGISPELILFITSCHSPALLPAVKSSVSKSMRNPARAVSASWQSMQWASMKARVGFGSSALPFCDRRLSVVRVAMRNRRILWITPRSPPHC